MRKGRELGGRVRAKCVAPEKGEVYGQGGSGPWQTNDAADAQVSQTDPQKFPYMAQDSLARLPESLRPSRGTSLKDLKAAGSATNHPWGCPELGPASLASMVCSHLL